MLKDVQMGPLRRSLNSPAEPIFHKPTYRTRKLVIGWNVSSYYREYHWKGLDIG